MTAHSDSKLATSEHEAVEQVELAVDTSDPTGTVKLSETEAEKQFGKSHQQVVRIPLPSGDPNDPLNWPKWAKFRALLSISFFAFLAAMNASCIVPALFGIVKEFHVTPQRASLVVSLSVLMSGLGNLFWIPFMRKFGKRTMFLSSAFVLFLTNIASPFAMSFNGLLAARLISNFLAGSADAAVPAFVGDVFFLYERGRYMMVYHIFLSAAFFLGPFIAGWIVVGGGWRWMIGFLGIANFVNMLMIFFFFRESSYDRDYLRPGPFTQMSYRQWLGVSSGYRRDVNPVKFLWRIVRLPTYPPILWAGFHVGVVSGANVTVSLASARFLSAPPYLFTPGQVGSFQVSGFIGSLCGFFVGGNMIDYIATLSTKRNHGVWEPEMRLVALIFPAVCGPAAMLIVGLCFRYHTPWIAPAIGTALLGFTITTVNNICVTYAVDSYLVLSGEVITIVFVIRNTISCLLAVYSSTWIENSGVAQALGTMGAILLGFGASCVVMSLFGKRLRQYTTKYGVLREVSRN